MGNLGSAVTFLLTISFLFPPPRAAQLNHGFSVLGDAGKFLINDVMFSGASFWTASEALGAV